MPIPPPVERDVRPADAYPFTPDTYPGPRPGCSYVFVAGLVRPLEPDQAGRLRLTTGEPLDGWLAALDAPPLAERIGVIAYGSNLCPGRLAAKGFHTLGPLVVVRAELHGLAAAWCAGETSYGSVPATLVRDPGSAEMHGVTFLERAAQLAAMDVSEGRPHAYVLAELEEGEAILEGGHALGPLLAYVDTSRGVLTTQGRPLLCRDLDQAGARAALATARAKPNADLLSYRVMGELR